MKTFLFGKSFGNFNYAAQNLGEEFNEGEQAFFFWSFVLITPQAKNPNLLF